jgi:hypothetical protein
MSSCGIGTGSEDTDLIVEAERDQIRAKFGAGSSSGRLLEGRGCGREGGVMSWG